MNLSFDPSEEFNKILEQYGRDVLVIRSVQKLRCSCYDEVNKEASRNCPYCFGIGWSFTAEKHKTRSEEALNETQIVNFMKNVDIGDVMAGSRKYYFSSALDAQENDLIVEVEWDKFGKPIYRNGGIWNVTAINRNQFYEGTKPVYKVYFTAQTPVRSKIRGIRISEIDGIVQYNVSMEG